MSDPQSVPQNITTHDMTRQAWGNGISIFDRLDTTGHRYQIVGHSRKTISLNDRINISGKDGTVTQYRVSFVEYYLDPRDMFKATIEYVAGMRCNTCQTRFDADDPRIADGTCPVCSGGES